MAEEHDGAEIPPPLARGLTNWVKSYRRTDRPLAGAELAAFWNEQCGEALVVRVDENERRAHEIIVAYRITRLFAAFRGLMTPEGLLMDVGEEAYGDPWVRWWPPVGIPRLSSELLVQSVGEACRQEPGVPLSPPEHCLGGEDSPLEHWLIAANYAYQLLGLHTHVFGRWGTEKLMRSDDVQGRWPCRDELVRFEAVVMDDCWRMVVATGNVPAALALERQYGFDPKESRSMVRAAVLRATRDYEVNLEEERVKLLERLEDSYRRAKQAMDLKAERNALRDMASILGMTRAEPDDIMKELTQAMRRVKAQVEPPRQLSEGSEPALLDMPDQFRRPARRALPREIEAEEPEEG